MMHDTMGGMMLVRGPVGLVLAVTLLLAAAALAKHLSRSGR